MPTSTLHHLSILKKTSIMRCILLFLLLGLFAPAGVSQVSARLKNKVSNSSSAIRNNKNKTTAERKQSLVGNDRPKQIENGAVDQGFDALEAGDYKSAIAAFGNYDASDADAAFGLGLAYYETEQFAEAIEPLKRALQLDPQQTDALYVLGLVYRVVEPDAYDPMSHRLAFSGVALALLIAQQFSPRAESWIRAFTEALGAGFTVWFLWISTLAAFSPARVLGLFTIVFASAMLFTNPWSNTMYLALVLVGTQVGLALGPPPLVDPLMVMVATTTLAVFSVSWSHVRARAERRMDHARRALAQAHADLERRIDERTADLRREVEERRLAEGRAEAASQAKTRFLATMSHELRTPLNAIVGYTELVREELGDPAADLDRVLAAARHLSAMIDDVLDIALVERGGVVLSPARLDARELLADVVAAVAPTASARDNRITLEVEPGLVVWGDRVRLTQVLFNLASNAVRFTRSGAIVLRGRSAPGAAVIEVVDTGLGIAEVALPHLFQKFFQVDGSTTRRHDGTGLGLAIARELTELHGGSIEVESKLGVGSTFRVRLPALEVALPAGA